MKRTLFLDADALIEMHEMLLEQWGGDDGGGHRGPVYEGADAAVQAVKNSYYDTLEELAAAYAVYIVQGHVFLDGNKRTGAAAMVTFLEINGCRSRISNSKLKKAMLVLQARAERGERTDSLVQWVASLL